MCITKTTSLSTPGTFSVRSSCLFEAIHVMLESCGSIGACNVVSIHLVWACQDRFVLCIVKSTVMPPGCKSRRYIRASV